DGVRTFFRAYHRNPDHPVIQDFVATLRPYAPDARAYDRFTEDWFFGLAVPEYRVATAEKQPEGEDCADCPWRVEVEILNAGSGSVPVEVAATRGRRFDRDGNPSADFRDCRTSLTPEAGRSATATLRCTFEPERLVVDPDVHVLQLQRRAASVRLR
ncbi:MAG: hypothetical protein MI919_12195, partial [Holophagales bacterium]|nr:hypothetical protein [Holophagales bacterium]